VAIVRVSGPGVGSLIEILGLAPLEARRASLRSLVSPADGESVDRVLATFHPGPGSYTGEDLLEIGCHGGALLPHLVLDAVLAAGARPARPGEFTRRAYLDGRIDLVQAEATADLIEAAAPALGRAALHQLEGGLSRRIAALRERLVEAQALVAYEIDFPDEDDGPVDPVRVEGAVSGLREELDALLRLAPEGEMLREGALTVIAGRPNAGKSSLFNVLLGFERAIVTEHPGTTRDAIEAVVSVEGYPFRLVDTAGLRENADPVEGMGIEVARSYLARAAVVLFCVEADRELGPEERAFLDTRSDGVRWILVRTKTDDGDPETPPSSLGGHGETLPSVRVSSRSGEGIPQLRTLLLDAAFSGLRAAEEAPLVTRRRHVRALREAREEIDAFAEARVAGIPPEVAVTHLQDATLRLEELLGVIGTEEVLDAVFGSFCIGK
jgi:tRNA modification GTPase